MNLSYREYRIRITDEDGNSIKLWIPNGWLEDFARVALYNVVDYSVIGGVTNSEKEDD